MNHCFACAKDAEGKPPCKRWCGYQQRCLSTLTYPEDYMQSAFEKGHFAATWAMENELAKMAQTTSPHRRVAAEDFYRVLRKIWPVAFDIIPTADSGVERAEPFGWWVEAHSTARNKFFQDEALAREYARQDSERYVVPLFASPGGVGGPLAPGCTFPDCNGGSCCGNPSNATCVGGPLEGQS